MKKIMSNFGLKLASLVFAGVIWLSVTNNQDPQISRQIRDVKVSIIDNSNYLKNNNLVGWAVDSSDLSQSVKVKGKKSIVDTLTSNDIKLVADLKNLPVQGSDGTVRSIPIEAVVENSNGTDIVDIELSNDKLEYNVEKKISKTFELKPVQIGHPDDKYIVGDKAIELDQVKIEGPESVVNSVTKATAEVDVAGLTRTMNVTANIVLRDKNGEAVETNDADASRIKIVNNNGKPTVRAEVEILEAKFVPIKCVASGEPADGYAVTGTVSTPDKIQIAGDSKVISKIKEITINDSELDVTGRTQDLNYTVELDKYLPDGVRFGEDSKAKATVVVSIGKLSSKNFAVDIKNIAVENPIQGYDIKVDTDEYDSVALTLLGMDSALAAVDENALKGSVDTAQFIKDNSTEALKDGVYSAKVKWNNLPEGVKASGDVEVYVRVSKTN